MNQYIIDHQERFFRFWYYSVSHSDLLLRSTKNEKFLTRIDVFFKAVKAIRLPTNLEGLVVRQVQGSEADAVIRDSGVEGKDSKVYLLEGTGYSGYVVAGIVAINEDEGDWYDNSIFLKPVNEISSQANQAIEEKRWEQIVRPILSADQDWEFKGGLAYRLPVRRFLIGIREYSPPLMRRVIITRVIMPLFIPFGLVNSYFTKRLTGELLTLDLEKPEVIASAVALGLSELPSTDAEALADLISQDKISDHNYSMQEVIGYSKVLLGDMEGAIKSLTPIAAIKIELTYDREMSARVHLILKLLHSEQYSQAIRKLDEWCEYTVNSLGLKR